MAPVMSMYSVLPLPLILAAVAGYWTDLSPASIRPTPDLAATAKELTTGPSEDGADVVISEPQPLGPSEIQRERDGLFYVRANVNGRPVRFLIDTGASVVVLSKADARAVGALPSAARYGARMATAGGDRPMAWTRLRSVTVAGHEVRGVTAAVVSGGPQVSLLGQNLLAKLGAVRIEGDKMAFEPNANIY